jgi:hypothetical protein
MAALATPPRRRPRAFPSQFFSPGGFGAEGAKPVRGALGGTHRFLALPESHRHYLAAPAVSKYQRSFETLQPLKLRQDPIRPEAGEFVHVLTAASDGD